MKYAVISDIHGNYPAFSADTNDAIQEFADGFILVGDYSISNLSAGVYIHHQFYLIIKGWDLFYD